MKIKSESWSRRLPLTVLAPAATMLNGLSGGFSVPGDCDNGADLQYFAGWTR